MKSTFIIPDTISLFALILDVFSNRSYGLVFEESYPTPLQFRAFNLDELRLRNPGINYEDLEEINRTEKKLNTLGLSLRSSVNNHVLGTQKKDLKVLKDQVTTAEEVYVNAKKSEIRVLKSDLEVVTQSQFDTANIAPEKSLIIKSDFPCLKSTNGPVIPGEIDVNCIVETIKLPTTTEIDLTKDRGICKPDSPLGNATLSFERWSDAGGDQDFGWKADAIFALKTAGEGLRLEGEAKVKGNALTKGFDILNSEVMFRSGKNQPTEGRMRVEIMNRTIYFEKIDAKSNIFSSIHGSNEKYIQKLDQNLLSITQLVGFIPVILNFGTKVETGPKYLLDAGPINIRGRAEWVSNVLLTASAGVGADLQLFRILAGIKGTLELISAKIGTYPEASLILDERNRPQIAARFDGRSRLRTLAGRFALAVEARSTFNVPQTSSTPPFIKYQPVDYSWNYDIGNYPGYEFPETIIFDKKINYDICTNRKAVSTIVANTPRPRDARDTFAFNELTRIQAIENKVIDSVDLSFNNQREMGLREKLQEFLENSKKEEARYTQLLNSLEES